MPELGLRAPTLADVDAVAAVINAAERRLTGFAGIDAAAVRGWWTQPPPFDLARDVVVATDGDAIVGYGDLDDQANDGTIFWLDVRGDAIATVHAELERRAAERIAPGGVIRAFVHSNDAPHRGVLEARGYVPIRSSYRMGIELAGRSFDPVWPDGATVRCAERDRDEDLLHELNERTFADHWGYTPTAHEEWLHWLLHMGEPDPSLWFVAEIDGTPAGLAICRPSEAGDPECGWVATLGVLPAFRGRGLGTALLEHAFAAFVERGRAQAGLGVDAQNTTGAVGLYQRAGMHVVHQQDIWELRA